MEKSDYIPKITVLSEMQLHSCRLPHTPVPADVRKKCGGLDMYATWKQVTFTWGPRFSRSGMIALTVERLVFWIVTVLFILLGIAGAVNAIMAISAFDFYTIGAVLVLDGMWLTWLGLLSLLYVGYRFYRFSESAESLRQVYDEHGEKKRHVELSRVLSKEAWQSVLRFWSLVKKNKTTIAGPVHLFSALLSDERIQGFLIRAGVNARDLQQPLNQLLSEQGKLHSNTAVSLDPNLQSIFFHSAARALDAGLDRIESQHLLLETVLASEHLKEILSEFAVDTDDLLAVASWFDIDQQMSQRVKVFSRFATLQPKSSMNRAMTATATPVLDHFASDMTRLAASGRLTFCIGREQVLENIFRLAESGSTNVLLIGPEGVGKSTVVGALAERMIVDRVPELFRDKRLMAISIPKLLAGANEPGMLEARLLALRDEVVRSGNIILCIDNIHDLVGASGQGDAGLDVSELVARIAERHEIPFIATTNQVDYRRFIAGKALGGVFENVAVPEPEPDEVLAILQSQVAYTEHTYGIYFPLLVLRKIVELSARFIYDHVFPEKALRLLDEVAVYVKNQRGTNTIATPEDVSKLMSQKTRMPLTALTQVESKALLQMEETIHKRLINQETAVSAVSSALRRARTELRDTGRPIVNLLFVGPTGVGKTELAKTVAAVYFGSEQEILRLDMSEYQSRESLTRLLGSESDPNSGYLTQGIKQRPYTVLLLDELEKAHPDILNIFLQIMDDGRITDWAGQTIDCTNLILIATSNAGTQFIQDSLRQGISMKRIHDLLLEEKLKESYRPEFLNRFDNVVVFTPLTQDHIKAVAKLMLKKNAKRLETKGITLTVTEAALDEMARAGYDPLYGARPLRRYIQDTVDDALAKYLLSGQLSRRDEVILDVGMKIRVKKARALG